MHTSPAALRRASGGMGLLEGSVSGGQVSWLAEELAAARALDARVGRLGWMNTAEQGMCSVMLLFRKVKA